MAKRVGISGVSTQILQQEIRRRQRQVGALQRKRQTLLKRLQKLDEQLNELGVGGGAVARGGTGRVRPQNKVSLVEALAAVLKGKTMTVSNAAEAVKKSGYKTNAANFRVMVNQTFIKHRNIFKKVSHGHYTTA
ncbi:MAG: hypothetical protein ACOYPS_01495 [Phycisphaerales bacterium]|jgi:hypothetical protein